MSEPQVLVRPSKMRRGNEILQILLSHDLVGILRQMQSGIPNRQGLGPEVRLRKLLEALGPTFIKLGQLLATRPDLVPQSYAEEFKNLYDGTTPSPFEEVAHLIHEETGKELHEIFDSFSEEALASASVGQVHEARLKDGTRVAVKLQHAGIQERVEVDFQILGGILSFIEKTFASSRIWQPTQHLDELRNMMDRELNYRIEMQNTQRVAHQFRHDDTVHIPHIYEEFSGKRMLVMEFVDGHKFSHPEQLDELGIDRKQVARVVTYAMAQQIFVNRFFHADPSPGNMKILASNQVAFLDFGAVGVVPERRAKAIFRLITGFSKGSVEESSQALIDLCDVVGEFDPRRFEAEVEKVLDFFERERLSVADPRMMEMTLNIAKTHHLLLPPDFLLINRALFQFDGFCRDLDPDYELVEVLEPLVGELVWKNITSTKNQKQLVEETVGELLKFARHAPHAMNSVLRRIERNELRTTIEVAGLEGLKRSHGRGVLKMSFSVMMAALIVGMAIVYAGADPDANAGPFMFGAGAVMIVWSLILVFWSEAMKGNRENE